MATPLIKLAQYWREDANDPDLPLTLPQRDAMRKCADELQQSFAQFRESKPFFSNNGDSEAYFITDGERLNCPHCGGSVHVDDVRPNGEARGASRLAGEASSREAATSTVVLGDGGEE